MAVRFAAPFPPLVILVVFATLLPEHPAALVATPAASQRPPPGGAATAEAEKAAGPAEEDGGGSSSPLRVAQCRARCLREFSGGRREDAVCLQGPDCFMCWENCELLQSNFAVWGAMCAEKGICFPGCQRACEFHREGGARGESEGVGRRGRGEQMEPVVHTRGHQVVQVDAVEGATAALVRWPRPPSDDSAAAVYVVMTKEDGADSWTQVTQTVDLEARLGDSPSSAVGRLDIRVLVVGPEGLITIYSPSEAPSSSAGPPTPGPSSPPLGGSGVRGGRWPLVIREDVTSPLDDAQLALLFPTVATDDAAAAAKRQPKQQPQSGVLSAAPWVPREVSLIHQGVLVIAEVSWEARRGGGVYLVTWEVDGGGLRGNLFTHTTCVTLSLWPRTLYHIQVEVASRAPGVPLPPDRSQMLHLDTRRAAPVVLAPEPQRGHPTTSPQGAPLLPTQQAGAAGGSGGGRWRRWWAGREAGAGTGAAVGLFLLALLFWRWRRGCRPCPRPPSTAPPPLPPAKGGEARGPLFFFLRSFDPEPTGPAAEGGGEGHRANGRRQWLQHPEPYADAFLREAERLARNEVQV